MSVIGSNPIRPAMANPAAAAQVAQGVLTDANRLLQSPAQWEQLTAVLTSLRPLAQTGAAFPMEPVPFTWRGDLATLGEGAREMRPGCCGGLQGQAALEDLVAQMDRLIATLQPGATAAAPGTSASSQASSLAGGESLPVSTGSWGSIDTMMAQAEKLAMSDKPSDQLKAQKLMMQAKQMFETISKLLQQLAEMAKTAISNIR